MRNLQQPTPNQDILRARRALEELDNVEILEDVQWDPLLKKWVLLCRLLPEIRNGLIPHSTNWYVHIDDSYPWGRIKFYPAKKEGLTKTFPHQNYNGEGKNSVPWREGDLCLDTNLRLFRCQGLDTEPFDVDSRLLWHVERALSWLQSADNNELLQAGEPFELPHFPSGSLTTLAFSENPLTFSDWDSSRISYGLVDIAPLRGQSPYIFISTNFKTTNKKTIYQVRWGSMVNSTRKSMIGVWIRLNDVPTISPWQVPMTLGELIDACQNQKVDIMEVLKKLAPHLRDGRSHLLLLGFPIPEKVGEALTQMYWQAMHLPILSYGKKVAKGFRANEKGYWWRDKQEVLKRTDRIVWLNSENWNRNEIFNRGKFPPDVSFASILQLGAGAVGSVIAELLVRGGQKELTIMDDDILVPGNLVRHTLSLGDIMEVKVKALEKRLNSCSPHTTVRGIAEKFPPANDEDYRLNQYNIILDCTGEDEVLHHLAHYPWTKPKTFISVSLGYRAKRLFVFTAKHNRFPHEAFIQLMQPFLNQEQIETSDEEFPREGIGCWHPVFPARADDIWLMSSTAIKYIESIIKKSSEKPKLMVFEQKWDGEQFQGVSLVYQEEYHE